MNKLKGRGGRRGHRFKNTHSLVSDEVTLGGFRFPSVKDVESVGGFFKSIRSYLIEVYGVRFPKAFTQAGVAEHVGYSTAQYIYIVERGEIEPSLELCAKLCEYYGVPMDYMYDLMLEIRAREYRKVFLERNKERQSS